MFKQKTNENGYTLLEIMITILILSILAGIATIIYQTQTTQAITASLKSDLRNAGIIMRTEATKQPSGKMLSYLPAYATQTGNNEIYIDPAHSNAYQYCLKGLNPDINKTYYYSSIEGKISENPCPTLATTGGTITPPATPGGPVTGDTPGGSVNDGVDPDSFTANLLANLQNEKTLIVSHDSIGTTDKTNLKNWFLTAGFQTVDLTDGTGFRNLTTTQLNEYKLIILNYKAWAAPADIEQKAYQYYLNGGLVIQEGNDTDANGGASPFIDTAINRGTAAGTFIPTYNPGLNPVFPYTWTGTAYASDSNSRCITGLKNGAIQVATDQYNNTTCTTMFAASGTGKWLYVTYMYNGIQKPVKAGIDWLLS